MTLLEDLELAAMRAEFRAAHFDDLGDSEMRDARIAEAARYRGHAARLRERLDFLRNLDDPRMAAWRLQVLGELEVINGGPVKP